MVVQDTEIVNRLLSNDSAFEDLFFNRLCVPLLSKIRWSLFDNKVFLDEITNEFILLLKKDDWQKLRSFGFRSTLFGWLKVVALHHFSAIKNELLFGEYTIESEDEELVVESATDENIKRLVELVTIPKYKKILWMKYVEGRTDLEIQEEMILSKELYVKLSLKSLKHFVCLIKNEGEFFEATYIRKKTKKQLPCIDPFEDSVGKLIDQIDIKNLICSIPNERYRIVLDSLILKDVERIKVAEILGTTVQNVDTIKCRAIQYLTAIVNKEKEMYGRL